MSSTWKFASDRYILANETIRGSLLLHGPAPGLCHVVLSAAKNKIRTAGPLLAVQSLVHSQSAAIPIGLDGPQPVHRLRGDCVDLALAETPRRPARLHLYWSTARTGSIDVEVLADTTHNFSQFEVLTLSRMPAGERRRAGSECLVAVARGRGEWVAVADAPRLGAQWLIAPRDHHAAALSLDGRAPPLPLSILTPPWHRPILCMRPAGTRWSYVEMAHPDDCVRLMARRIGRCYEWSFGLFGLDLEKGVILRGRLRAAVVPRARDLAHAQRLFNQFSRTAPHLSV